MISTPEKSGAWAGLVQTSLPLPGPIPGPPQEVSMNLILTWLLVSFAFAAGFCFAAIFKGGKDDED